jgi:tetratricopeptide (TPR) repeat protein
MCGLKNVTAGAAIVCGILVFAASCASVKPAPEAPAEEAAPAPPLAERFIDKLAARLDAGDLDGAIALFDELTAEEAGQKFNRRLKASVLLSARRLPEAREIAERLVSEDENDIESLYILANVEAVSGKAKEHRLLLERIVKDAPDHVPALNDLGQVFIGAKRLKDAAGYFDRALAASPLDMDATLGRANVYRLEHKFDAAEALFSKAVELYPERSEPYSERGRFYRETGKINKALADLDRAGAIDPNDYWVRYDRGRALLDARKKSEALAEFDAATALNPGIFIACVYSAGIRDELEDVDGAARDYEALIRLRPDYYFAFEGLGIQRMKQGRYAEAADAFAAAYKAAPGESGYAMLAAVNMLKGGRKQHEVKPFVDQAMRKISRERLDYHVLRLFFDFSGDADVIRRLDREKNQTLKAQMMFYMANYYDIRGNLMLADKFFTEFRDMKRMDIVEWRLNEWILKERNLQIGGAGDTDDADNGEKS